MADWTYGQACTDTGNGNGTAVKSKAFGATLSSSSFVVGVVFPPFGVTVLGVTDDKANAYGIAASANDANTASQYIFYSKLPINNAPQTLQVTHDQAVGAGSFDWIIADAFAAPAGAVGFMVDGYQFISQSPAAATLPSFRTNSSDVLQWAYSLAATSATTGTSAGFSAGQGSGTVACTEWKILSSASSAVATAFSSAVGNIWSGSICIAPIVPNEWQPVAMQQQRSGSSLSASITLPRAAPPGSIVFGSLAISDINFNNLTSILDDKGNSYSLIPGTQTVTGVQARGIFWSNGIVNNGPKTITATLSVAQTVIFMLGQCWLPPPNTTSVSIGSSTSSGVSLSDSSTSAITTTPNITTTKNKSLLYSFGDSGGSSMLPANGFSGSNGVGITWADGTSVEPLPITKNSQWAHVPAANNTSVALVSFTPTIGGGLSVNDGYQVYP